MKMQVVLDFEKACELAECLAHEACLETYRCVSNLPLNLGTGDKRAATESMTTTSMALERTSMSHLKRLPPVSIVR